MQFDELGLHHRIVRAVTRQGYASPTQIQCKAIPLILAGHDLLGCAQTGTGKTAAFALPTLHHLFPERMPNHRRQRPNRRRSIEALVLVPTRELAIQVHKSFESYGRSTDLRSTVIYGGVSQDAQVNALQAGTDIVVATPGRLLDLIKQGHVKLHDVKVLVFDEADQMLDLGFLEDLKKIVKQVPQDRQTLMFSATMPDTIRQLASQWLHRPKTVHAAPVASTPAQIKQQVVFVEPSQKLATLVQLLLTLSGERQLVFCRTKRGVDSVVRHLQQAELHALAIHGDKRQGARERALARFCSPHPPVLVATDVAARGLQLPGISHVINFELPEVPETYVHRIGRTARAGAEGDAISLCSAEERPLLKRIEALTQQAVVKLDLETSTAVGRKRVTPQRGESGRAAERRAEARAAADSGSRTSKRRRSAKGQRGKQQGRRNSKSRRSSRSN